MAPTGIAECRPSGHRFSAGGRCRPGAGRCSSHGPWEAQLRGDAPASSLALGVAQPTETGHAAVALHLGRSLVGTECGPSSAAPALLSPSRQSPPRRARGWCAEPMGASLRVRLARCEGGEAARSLLKEVLSTSPPDPLSADGTRARHKPWRRRGKKTWGVGGAWLPPPGISTPSLRDLCESRGCRLMQGDGLVERVGR